MSHQSITKDLAFKTDSKIVFIVLDGIGGHPLTPTGKTELETARTPNLNKLASLSILGLSNPIAPGITPGSGPGHLGLFGYDPFKSNIGRGVLAALGIGFPLRTSDIAARINFCTANSKGIITDRRAGRIPTSLCAQLTKELDKIKIKGVEIFVRPVRDHRASLIIRGKNFGGDISDSDPQKVGLKPKPLTGKDIASKRTIKIVNQFVLKAQQILADKKPANMVLLRGFAKYQKFPSMKEIYNLNSACIAVYPMYKGVARLVGMEILEGGETLDDEIAVLKEKFNNHDFFFLHVKKTDSAGEDGNFKQKVKIIEDFDKKLPRILNLEPDVVVITGDHSTPSVLKSHSWHTVPLLIYSKYCRPDAAKRFGEADCLRGGLGIISTTDIMTLAMANALKLEKFGA
ncbi:MAG: 2,3-bisphosphoglycerate-independent phosphoglycerate mutase [Nitrospinota bacterium]